MPPESFLLLPEDQRREALDFAASKMGRPANLLEKDVWVVQSLDILFSSPLGEHLVFKGGTALSKVHQIIQRFSEDIDVTYDIRQLVPETAGSMGAFDVIPSSRAQQEKLTDAIRKTLLPAWLQDEIHPLFQKALANIPNVRLEIPSSAAGVDTLQIAYPTVTPASQYAQPVIKLEFGARSTGEPAHAANVTCDMAFLFGDLSFPTATPRTMDLSRIFWEKATAIHVHCLQDRPVAHRFFRHFYDLAKLNMRGHASQAIATREVAHAVAAHKARWFREKDFNGEVIDYNRAINGELILVPEGEALEGLRKDYEAMLHEGLLSSEEADTFDSILGHCRGMQDEANQIGKGPRF